MIRPSEEIEVVELARWKTLDGRKLSMLNVGVVSRVRCAQKEISGWVNAQSAGPRVESLAQ